MEIGIGIGIAGLSISVAAVAITAIKVKGNTSNGNGNGAFSQKLCDERHKSLEGWMKGIDSKLNELVSMHMKED